MNIVTHILPLFITIFMFSFLRSSHHFHLELHRNFSFFFINTAVRYDLLDKFHSEHSACFKFLSFQRACMFLYVRKSQRTSPQANRNEKLVPNVSFPFYPSLSCLLSHINFYSELDQPYLKYLFRHLEDNYRLLSNYVLSIIGKSLLLIFVKEKIIGYCLEFYLDFCRTIIDHSSDLYY